mmetsp:Transcript_20583/g.48836  ORF Transcript_20583/g.48836 Transcript_20583/m.48836 type:complete len:222 (-) Transcript_20583:550-1215(-)
MPGTGKHRRILVSLLASGCMEKGSLPSLLEEWHRCCGNWYPALLARLPAILHADLAFVFRLWWERVFLEYRLWCGWLSGCSCTMATLGQSFPRCVLHTPRRPAHEGRGRPQHGRHPSEIEPPAGSLGCDICGTAVVRLRTCRLHACQQRQPQCGCQAHTSRDLRFVDLLRRAHHGHDSCSHDLAQPGRAGVPGCDWPSPAVDPLSRRIDLPGLFPECGDLE